MSQMTRKKRIQSPVDPAKEAGGEPGGTESNGPGRRIRGELHKPEKLL